MKIPKFNAIASMYFELPRGFICITLLSSHTESRRYGIRFLSSGKEIVLTKDDIEAGKLRIELSSCYNYEGESITEEQNASFMEEFNKFRKNN